MYELRRSLAEARPDCFDQFISGGYYLVNPVKRPDVFSQLLPETILTVSPCIADVGPRCMWEDDWTGGKQNGEVTKDLGTVDTILKRTSIPENVQRSATGSQVMPFGLSSFAVASAFFKQLPQPTTLLGIGLHSTLLPLVREQRHQAIGAGYGLRERLAQRQCLCHGTVLGFEVLGFEAMSFHSWLCCCNSPDDVDRELGIQPAANGFIANLEDATRVTEHIRKTGAEPAIWLPWLVIQYDRESTS